MLIPTILQRGHSLDQQQWTAWFTLRHEDKTLTTHLRKLHDEATGEWFGVEVRIEFALLGVPYIRGLFAWADSQNNKAYPTLTLNTLPRAREWIENAFDIEVRHEAAPLLGAMRNMGMVYMKPEQVPDASEYYQEQLQLLQFQQQHYSNEQQGSIISPDRYSAFTDALPDLNFDTEIADE